MRFIFSLSFIILAIITFFVFTKPLNQKVNSLKAEVLTYQDALINSNNLENLRDSLLVSYRDIKKEDIDKLNHLLPNTVNSIELVLEIEKIANNNGVYISGIKFGSSENKLTKSMDSSSDFMNEIDTLSALPYGEFLIEFNVDGNYQSFNRFLKELESNLRIVDIESMSFDVSNEENSSTDLSYKLKIKTYWLK